MAAFNMDGNGRIRNGAQQDDPALFSFFNISSHSNRSSLQSLHSARASLPQMSRRFTTTNLPTTGALPAIGQQRVHTFDSHGQDLSFSMHRDTQVRERKEAEYNFIKKKRLQFQQEMNALEREEERLRSEMGGYGAGHQSEPATPPEHLDNGFPTALSRPNRFSSSSVVSPIGTSARSSLTGSQIASPPSERDRTYATLTGFSPQSTSRASEEDDEYHEDALSFDHRKAASLNRNSMPVTRRDHGAQDRVKDTNTNTTIDHVNTTAFLFGDDYMKKEDLDMDRTPTTKHLPTFLQMHTNDDKFPILVRHEGEGELSASDALDPVSAHAKEHEPSIGGWPSFSRHSVQSYSVPRSNTSDSPPQGLPQPSLSGTVTPTSTGILNRHSMGPRIGTGASDSKRSSLHSNGTADKTHKPAVFPNLQPSLSTSSVPTMNTINAGGPGTPQKFSSNSISTPEQRLHNHNVSLGRIPPSTVGNKRQSREYSAEMPSTPEEFSSDMSSPQSPQGIVVDSTQTMPLTSPGAPSFNNSSAYGYGTPQTANMQAMDNAMSNLQLQNQATLPQWNNPSLQMFSQPYVGAQYGPFQNNFARYSEAQPRSVQQRRNPPSEDPLRFSNVSLESLEGEILQLCKDQHGCRFLQKKLDDRKTEHIQMIFTEIKNHMIELMIDPFGNYLCQKLLECTDDDQRTELINNAAPEMVGIALNQHGTRALQKMIEFVSTPVQVQTVTKALEHSVVQMIQDLNGNHVIQKCLNRLSNTDAQFIFDAVSANCVTVGTHRHGCCVIQRCIDHASGDQKAQLVEAISECSMDLVQDPFGNYVLQYIFDLEEPQFSQPLCRTFLGEIVKLSKQKFSSNVVEKCIRIADDETKHAMIQELIHARDFEKIADDPYANYVVQTAWDHATTVDEAQLAEKIRPVLPRMRQKPYGRRFQNKVTERDKKLGINTSGTMTPSDVTSPDTIASPPANFNTSYNQFLQSPPSNYTNYRPPYGMPMPTTYIPNFGPQSNRMENQPLHNFNPYQAQNSTQQPYNVYQRNPHHGTGWY